MKGPRTAGYHHHQFKVMDEMKHHHVLKAQDALTEDLMFSFCLIAVSRRPPPCYVTVDPLIVLYHFRKQLGFYKYIFMSFLFCKMFDSREKEK